MDIEYLSRRSAGQPGYHRTVPESGEGVYQTAAEERHKGKDVEAGTGHDGLS